CWVGFELGEPCLRDVVSLIGHKKLIYGSDFPHPDHSQFSIKNIQLQMDGFSDDELVDLLEQNAKDFYGFEDIKNEEVLFKSEDQLAEVN
ncbi:MAG: amidohydrolase family protein, partial [Marinomonas sp.]